MSYSISITPAFQFPTDGTAALDATLLNLLAAPTAALTGTADTNDFTDLSVTTAKLAELAVTTAKLAELAVTEGKLAASAVTATKLGADAVTTAKILDANVTATKLATDAVETAKIKDLNVTTDKLAAGAVTADKLAAGAVNSSALGYQLCTAVWNGTLSTITLSVPPDPTNYPTQWATGASFGTVGTVVPFTLKTATTANFHQYSYQGVVMAAVYFNHQTVYYARVISATRVSIHATRALAEADEEAFLMEVNSGVQLSAGVLAIYRLLNADYVVVEFNAVDTAFRTDVYRVGFSTAFDGLPSVAGSAMAAAGALAVVSLADYTGSTFNGVDPLSASSAIIHVKNAGNALIHPEWITLTATGPL